MISYAGVALGLPTAELVDFIESTIDPRDAFLFPPRTFPGTRLNSLPFRQGLTFPPVRLGRLWWPAGASRFALFYGLADQAQLDLIRAVVYPSAGDYQAAPLVLADGVNTLTTDLWMLPPRPLQGLTDLPLYLLTLVDERYFWWFRSSSLAVVGGTTTWTDLFDQIEAALDITLTTDTVPAAYLKPGDGFSLNDEPLPIVLDAVCASAGLRLVRQLDGTCHAWDAENSRDQTAAFLLTVPTAGIIDGSAGGVFQLGTEAPLADDVAVLPDSVTVVYPISDSGAAAGDIEYNVPLVDLALDDFAGVVGFPGQKVFHCSAVALGTGTPTNDAALQALAEQIATDFYRWQCGRLDLRLVGYPAYTITGLDDAVLYDHGADLSTRILRGPWLDHLEELLVWTGPQPGTGLTLSVGEVDLAPLYTDISTLLFDEADGFTVSQPSAGVAQVNLTVAPSGSECWPAYAAAVDADQDDYNPSALLWWKLSRGSSPSNVNITGIAAGEDGCPILITHAGRTGDTGAYSQTITLKNQSSSSAAANRIIVSDYEGFGDRVLHSGESVLLRYDTSRSRWRVLELPVASLTQPGTVSLLPQSMGAGAKYFSDKVGIGTSSPLANSVLDVRGYTYSYFAGIISFGGGNTPTSEADGAILQYAGGGSPAISLTIAASAYASGAVGGILIQGSRFVLRHKTASPKYSFYNDDTSAYTDGGTATVNGLTFVGGLYTSGSGLSGGGGISIGGGGAITNTGVTSIIAGTGISVSSATGDVTVSLTIPVSIAHGGTNSVTALNNNRIMVSASGAIVEAAALTNGQLLIGSTGAAPVAANLIDGAGDTTDDGSGIVITGGAGSITLTTSGGAGHFTVFSGAAINAAGTTQGTATAITTDTARVTTSIGQTGVILPALPGYARIFLDHVAAGAPTMNIFPPTGGQINALGANNAATLAAGAQVEAWSVKADNSQWYTR